MQNNGCFLFIILLFFGCSNSHNIENDATGNLETHTSENEVTVKAENNTQDCHMCPGYILIERGNTIDTLKGGSWGKPLSSNQFKANDRDYIALESSYHSGGINESKLSILSLNEDNYLSSVFDTLVSDEQIDYFSVIRRGIEFRAPDTLLFIQHSEIFNSNDESSIRADYLSELYIIESLSSGSNLY